MNVQSRQPEGEVKFDPFAEAAREELKKASGDEDLAAVELEQKDLVRLAKSLPVAPWVIGVRGVGLLSLAAIVGEAGDLSGYANPAKLWKRLGLAVMSDGRQRRTTGAAAIAHGYVPARRSVMWNVGACIIKAKGPLKAIYDERKLYELPRVESKAHAHNRAQRYVEKRFLRDLWAAWNAQRPQCD
jgi:hypothetical protein